MTTDERFDVVNRALRALRLEVPGTVADDFERIMRDALASLRQDYEGLEARDRSCEKVIIHQDHSCSQCDGGHDHQWVTAALTTYPGNKELVTRCAECGARKCDWEMCMLRRHHAEAHAFADGSLREVGK